MENIQIFVLEHESYFRFGSFLVLLVLFLLLESFWPRRNSDQQFDRRINNLMLQVINLVVLRLFVPLATIQVAIITTEQQTGLFNVLSTPFWLNVLLTIIVFDLLIYIQHVVFHKFNFLWLIHRVHHTDLDFDVTTGIRFHPIEIIISMVYKLFAVYLLGPNALAIVIYEILLNGAALFTHSNILINKKIDSVIRLIFVTPDMHRVHHSVIKRETNSNYGNLFSFWDKLFQTYNKEPEAGYENMVIGLDEFRDKLSSQILFMLKTPFLLGR